MKDDVSEIPKTGCNVLISEKQINNYTNSTRKTYIFNGGKWYHQITSTNSPAPTTYECIDVSSLNTNEQFEPIYFICGFGLTVFLGVMLWRVIRIVASF